MANYISQLSPSTVLIGVTADDASASLTTAATIALLAIGVNVSSLGYRGKVAFVAYVGRPSASEMNLAPADGRNVHLSAIVQRKYSLYCEPNFIS